MTEWSANAYVKQTLLYLENGDYGKAYEFSKEFVEKNPKDMMAQFLFAKSAFWTDSFDEAIDHGSRAFNLAANKEDMALCAIVIASAYFKTERYQKGYALLKTLDATKNEDVQKLLLLFSIALNDQKSIENQIAVVYEINSKMIEELLY
jgi:tetratricopeptide (TPR) repeat protein